jgi:hypothetical protein
MTFGVWSRKAQRKNQWPNIVAMGHKRLAIRQRNDAVIPFVSRGANSPAAIALVVQAGQMLVCLA